MRRPNEGKCCDAVIKIIEARTGHARTDLKRDRPDDPGVEIECSVGPQRYAIEHTIIEPYPEKDQDDRAFMAVLPPVAEQLRALPGLPADSDFQLWAQAGALGKLRADYGKLSERIFDWAKGAIFQIPPPLGEINPVTLTLPGRPPIKLTLARLRKRTPGGPRVDVARSVENYQREKERRKRIGETCKAKLPKLKACRDRSLRTVLVLENRDEPLTNSALVEKTLTACLQDFDPEWEPDDVYQIDTDTPAGSPWTVWTLRRDRRQVREWVEFDPGELLDLMAA